MGTLSSVAMMYGTITPTKISAVTSPLEEIKMRAERIMALSQINTNTTCCPTDKVRRFINHLMEF